MMKQLEEIYIFDIDGVITDINTHKIEEKHLLGFIIQILNKDEPIAFNTGRPLVWVREELLTPIMTELKDKTLLKNLFISVEKGGEWISFNDKGNEIVEIDNSINIPDALKDTLRKLVKDKFPNKIFYDEDKKTMITLQKDHNLSIEEFNSIHPSLNSEIENILDKHDTEGKFKLVPTTLDTDIESVIVGKDYAMGKILEWLNNKNIEPKKFKTFGDSLSDLEMAKHLFEKNHEVNFIYVGKKYINPKDYNFPIIFTSDKYDKGTVEYLRNN